MGNNVYRTDLQDQRFLLWDFMKLDKSIFNGKLSPDFDRATADEMLALGRDFAYQYLGSNYTDSPELTCSLDADGMVKVPAIYHDLWKVFREKEWAKMIASPDEGGLNAPYILYQAINEMFLGANPSFITYTGFGIPISYIIKKFGTSEQVLRYVQKLTDNEWAGAFCVTESQAGSDVGAITTVARRREDGTYSIRGNKVFISAGMHDLTENIVYVVLARVDGAPGGTRGLSAFIVPRKRLERDNETGADNFVRCVGIERKMGLHGCCTAQLSFGDNGETLGELIGQRENIGLLHILEIMNQARIATGIYSVGMASSAYHNAIEYARTRFQGTRSELSFNPEAPRVALIEHEDVRRMLFEMRWRVEGGRALIYQLAFHQTIVHSTSGGSPKDQLVSDFLTPLVKAYCSDQAWKVCELAIQIHGGYGYISDFPVEQYARDVKIMSIWEGTNYFQSVDLVRFKMKFGMERRAFDHYLELINHLDAGESPDLVIREGIDELKRVAGDLSLTFTEIGRLFKQGQSNFILSRATQILDCTCETVVAYLLLSSAVLAEGLLRDPNLEANRAAFLKGKVALGRYFTESVLSGLSLKLANTVRFSDTVLTSRPEWF